MLTLESELFGQKSQSLMVASVTSFLIWRSWLRVKEAWRKGAPGSGGVSGEGAEMIKLGRDWMAFSAIVELTMAVVKSEPVGFL